MHPVTAILGLLLLTAGLAWGRWSLFAATALVVGLLYTTSRQGLLRGLFHRLRRLRWLFLSIIVLYGWFTPGLPIWESLGGLSPTVAGMAEGSLRCLNLVVILAAVHWLLSNLDRESLVSGVYWVARPLRPLGLQPVRIAVRLVLTLEYLDRVQAVRPAPKAVHGGPVLDRLAAWFRSVLESAEDCGLGMMDLAVIGAPTARDWSVLLAIAAGLAFVGVWFPV